MRSHREFSHIVIDGIMYPPLGKWDGWLQRQQWLCGLGRHYLLPVGKCPGLRVERCVCGRCGYSTWQDGKTWKLQIQWGYWRQAGRPVPAWRQEQTEYLPPDS